MHGHKMEGERTEEEENGMVLSGRTSLIKQWEKIGKY